jgi:hypothetical protein
MSNKCESCGQSGGCTDRLSEARTEEEVNSAPYLILCAVAIVLATLGARWLFQ